jgi:uncharacterized tellurite resistance protein B-like protein
MLDQILDLLRGGAPQTQKPEELQLAVAVLLVEAARMDNQFQASERHAIERLLSERFHLTAEATRDLVAQAQRRADETNQLYPFTRMAVERMSYGERVKLIEMLWEVAYADGVLDPDEDALLRRVAGLIYVSDQDRGAARQRVLQRRAETRKSEG